MRHIPLGRGVDSDMITTGTKMSAQGTQRVEVRERSELGGCSRSKVGRGYGA